MDIQQLAEEAGRVINNPIRNAAVVLQMPGEWGDSSHRHLAGANSPLGEIVQENADGIIVRFDAIDVLAFCVANGAKVNIKREVMPKPCQPNPLAPAKI